MKAVDSKGDILSAQATTAQVRSVNTTETLLSFLLSPRRLRGASRDAESLLGCREGFHRQVELDRLGGSKY